MAGHRQPETLGDVLVPVINHLQDIFSQVEATGRWASAAKAPLLRTVCSSVLPCPCCNTMAWAKTPTRSATIMTQNVEAVIGLV